MQYAEMFKDYLNEQAGYMDEIRSIKHDMQAHLIVLQYYLKAENYDKARAYLDGMMTNQKLWSPPVTDVGNEMVNAVIQYALKKSKKPIEFQHRGLLPEEMDVEDMDLCTVFSNLLSNSVEACERLEHTIGRIVLEIHTEGKNLLIIVENPIEKTVQKESLGKETSKKDKKNHGYGIRNVRAVAQKYNGKMEFDITESLFRVKILFSEVVKSTLIC